MKKRILVATMIFCVGFMTVLPVSQAFNFGDLLKVGGIGFVIDRFSGQLNSFINTLTFNKGAGSNYATKVVPVLSFGNGSYVGAAQVMGSQELVDKTQSVIQIEGDFSGSTFRVKALVPIDSKNPVNFSRVNGVGVSAMIDVRI